jgi:hypothetical protein
MAEQNPLDWAKLDLERFNAITNAQVSLSKAQADYAFRMMEVAEKQVKVETDILKLKIKLKAFRAFEARYHHALADLAKLQRELKRNADEARAVAWIRDGENLSPALVTFVWSGFYYFLHILPPGHTLKADIQEISDAARSGEFYSHNSRPEEQCPSVPANVKIARELVMWLRKHNYMPKIDTPPYVFLYNMAIGLTEQAEELALDIEEHAKAKKAEVDRLDSANWKQIDINTSADVDDDAGTTGS